MSLRSYFLRAIPSLVLAFSCLGLGYYLGHSVASGPETAEVYQSQVAPLQAQAAKLQAQNQELIAVLDSLRSHEENRIIHLDRMRIDSVLRFLAEP